MTCRHCDGDSLKDLKDKGLVETEHPEDYEQVDVCARHGGMKMLKTVETKRFHNYLIEKSNQETFNRFAESDQITSLRGEIAILRHMIENIYNDCSTDADKFMLYSSRLSDLIVKCEKLVTSCNRIELKADMFLNETLAIQFALSIVEIVKKHVTDSEKIKQISSEIPLALESVVNNA